MADNCFAQNQMQKYGWMQGKGLGRTESGITDAIKPKLKFDTAGMGHNAGEQFSFHWWDHVFNSAAKNISVKNSEEGVKVSLKGSKDDLISNKRKTSKVKAKSLLYGSFVKHGTMKADGLISQEKTSLSSSSDDSESDEDPPESYEGNDERLYKACGGRTAHKGARHGLHLSGKLKRIQMQENRHGNRIQGEDQVANVETEMEADDSRGLKRKEDGGDSVRRREKKERRKKRKHDETAAAQDSQEVQWNYDRTGEEMEDCVDGEVVAVDGIEEEMPKKKSKKKKKKHKSSREEDIKNDGLHTEETSKRLDDSFGVERSELEMTKQHEKVVGDYNCQTSSAMEVTSYKKTSEIQVSDVMVSNEDEMPIKRKKKFKKNKRKSKEHNDRSKSPGDDEVGEVVDIMEIAKRKKYVGSDDARKDESITRTKKKKSKKNAR
ncbi:uncharacterized protein [Diadema antillarum]|uniref:uncharacterized protein isoform X2 n=1 Tax=Diadema antillarum TaxID=105358 RepID=UPI003A8B062A